MKRVRLGVLATVSALLALTALTGCTDDGDDGDSGDGGEARTMACRTYLLAVGGQDELAADLLDRAVSRGSWDNDLINGPLAAVQAAAKEAGLVEDLSDDDFDRYYSLVQAVGTAYAQVNPDGGPGLTAATAAAFRRAFEPVREACEPA